jgi:hypothetical protein
MQPLWYSIFQILFAVAVAVVLVGVYRRRRRGIMHDRNALAKKFNVPPEDIIEIERRPGE